MESSISDRLRNVIGNLGLSDSQFADKCGISRPTLSLILSGKNKKISDVLLKQIHETFPQVSIMWLLFGEGQLNINKENSRSDEQPSMDSEYSGHNFPSNDDFPSSLEFSSQNFSDENEKSLYEDTIHSKEHKEKGVNPPVEPIEDIINKRVNLFLENAKLKEEIEKLKEKEKKIVRINIYYDDSTFETLIPGEPKK